MTNLPSISPVVHTYGGKVSANSKDVAAFFKKQHAHVLRDIRNLGCSDAFRRSNFGSNEINDLTGTSTESVDMSKDGFTFLVMGYTGKDAAGYKEAYIGQFNAMEDALRNRPAIDLDSPDFLRSALLTYTEKVIALEGVVAAQAPKVDAYDQISNAEGLVNLTMAAKTIGIPPRTLVKWCDVNGYTYKRGSQRMAYQAKINAGLLEMKMDTIELEDGRTKAVYQTFVTPKGVAKLATEVRV
jgi:anti-repressor protein